jgi:chaperonin GroEL (HSP60 family)
MILEQLFWENSDTHCCRNIKRSNKKTFEIVGDGTTLTCVLVQAFFKKLLEELKKELHLLK